MVHKDVSPEQWGDFIDSTEQVLTISSKKRKQVSEAEKVALELSKLTSKQAQQSKLEFDDGKVNFMDTSRCPLNAEACNWKDKRQTPCYCRMAEFRFEASLPDRGYLTRYSVTCSRCYEESDTTFHLYCSYCDEILTGSIAGPGGKITDHVITIRHVYKEATAVKSHLERRGMTRKIEHQKAKEYVSKLEQWSEAVRFPRSSLRKSDFDELLKTLRVQIQNCSLMLTVGETGAAISRVPKVEKEDAAGSKGHCHPTIVPKLEPMDDSHQDYAAQQDRKDMLAVQCGVTAPNQPHPSVETEHLTGGSGRRNHLREAHTRSSRARREIPGAGDRS